MSISSALQTSPRVSRCSAQLESWWSGSQDYVVQQGLSTTLGQGENEFGANGKKKKIANTHLKSFQILGRQQITNHKINTNLKLFIPNFINTRFLLDPYKLTTEAIMVCKCL